MIILLGVSLPASTMAAIDNKELRINVCPNYTPNYEEVIKAHPNMTATVNMSQTGGVHSTTQSYTLEKGSTVCTNGFSKTVRVSFVNMLSLATMVSTDSSATARTLASTSTVINEDGFTGTTKVSLNINTSSSFQPQPTDKIVGTVYVGNQPFPIKVTGYSINARGTETPITVHTKISQISLEPGIFIAQEGIVPGKYRFRVDENTDDAKKAIQGLSLDGTIRKLLIGALNTMPVFKAAAWTVDSIAAITEAGGVVPAVIAEAMGEEQRFQGYVDVTYNSDHTFTPDPARIDLEVVTVSALDRALSSAIKTLAEFVGSFTRTAVEGINHLLERTTEIVLGTTSATGETTKGVEGAWTKTRNIALTLLIMALIIIAFANVLQIDIEQYGLNRMIPKIIISIIMAYLSWIIVTFFFDFGKALQDQAWGLLSGGKDGSGLSALRNIKIYTPTGGDILAKGGATLVLVAILIGILICLIILWFSLLMRVVVLSFLLAVAPIAFILNIVPFTSNLYKQWWNMFFKWMFMGPIAVVIIALGSVVASGSFEFSGTSMTLTGENTVPGGSGWNMLIGLLIFGASIYVAATLPLKWGGNLMKGWQKAGNWGKNNLLGGKYVKQGWQDFSKARSDRGMLRYSETRAALANKMPGGRLLTGTNKAQATALKEGIDKTYEGMFGKLEATDLQNEIARGGRKGMIASKVMQDKYGDATKGFAEAGQIRANGTWATEDPELRKAWEDAAKAKATGGSYAGAVVTEAGTGTVHNINAVGATSTGGALGQWMNDDRDFSNYMVDKNAEAALAVATSTNSPDLSGQIRSSEAGKSWQAKNAKATSSLVKNAQSVINTYGAPVVAGGPNTLPAATQAILNRMNAAGTGPDDAEARIKDLMSAAGGGMSAWEAGELVAAHGAKTDFDRKYNTGAQAPRKKADLMASGSTKQVPTFDAIDRLNF